MSDAIAPPLQRPSRLQLNWLLPALFKPRATLALIAAEGRPIWLTPMLVLSLTALLVVMVAGPIKAAAVQSGQALPPDFQYFTPEQQAQFLQAQAATTGPVFVYVFSALLALLRLWFGWLVMGGLLHLVLTLFGGRGSAGAALNLVAWASLPFAIRDLVRAAVMQNGHALIASPGLAGFAPTGTGWAIALASEALARVDIYGLWYLALLIIGARAMGGLKLGSAVTAVVIAAVIALLLGILPGVVASQFSGLTVVRPFFF
ncbi:MAG: YIP1 family protein [Anaerolineales bacterium]